MPSATHDRHLHYNTAAVELHRFAFRLPLRYPTSSACSPCWHEDPKSTHDASYWARVTKGLDFSDADRVDPLVYNRILWKGMMHNRPYPPSLSLKNRPVRGDDDNDRRNKTEKRPASYCEPANAKSARSAEPQKN